MMNSMSMNDLKRLRIDHIGSLVRPAKLKEAFAATTAGSSAANNWPHPGGCDS